MMQNVYLGNVYLTFFAMINVQDMLDRFFVYFDSQQKPVTTLLTFHFSYLNSPRWMGPATALTNVVLHYLFWGGCWVFWGGFRVFCFFEACKCQLAG